MSSTTPMKRPAWEEARLRNAEQSALYRLPNEILVQILDLLSNPMQAAFTLPGAFPEAKADAYFFRHVCHRFAQLYAHPRYDSQRSPKKGYHVVQGPLPGYGLSSSHETSPYDNSHDLPVRRRLHASGRDRCATCTAYRADDAAFAARVVNLQHPLSCRSCRWDHPAIAFPPDRRAKKSVSRRVCIARTGRIRLCMHVGFSSSMVHSWMHPYEDNEGIQMPLDLEDRDDHTEYGWPMKTCKSCFKDKQQLRGPELRLPTVYVDHKERAKMVMRWTCPVVKVNPADEDVPTDKILQQLAWMDAKPEYRCLIGEQSSYTSARVVQAVRALRPGEKLCLLGFGPSDPRKLFLRLNEAKDTYFLECITAVHLSRNETPSGIDDCTDFIPLLTMQSVNLPKDDETRHVTWCPDPSCRTGKGFDAHLLTVKHWDQCAREGKELTSQWRGPPPKWRAMMGASQYRAIMRKPMDGIPYVPYSVQMAQLEPQKESWIMGKLRGVLKR